MLEGPKRVSRRVFLRWLGYGGLALAAVGAESVREAYTFRVRNERVALAGLHRTVRAAVLSDLHLGPFIGERQLAGWVRAAAAAQPDIVFLVGDLVDARYRGDLSEFRRWLPELRSSLGTYVVPGNHDRARYPDLVPWERMLDAVGATVLINRGLLARSDLYVAGVDDVRRGSPDVRAAMRGVGVEAGRATGVAAEAGRATGSAPPARPALPASVLLSHNPDILPELTPDLGPLPELVLSGHTHGGQVCLPGYGPIVTGSRYGRRYAAGWVSAPVPAFVTRGLGVSALPIRLACPAELVIMRLEPA